MYGAFSDARYRAAPAGSLKSGLGLEVEIFKLRAEYRFSHVKYASQLQGLPRCETPGEEPGSTL